MGFAHLLAFVARIDGHDAAVHHCDRTARRSQHEVTVNLNENERC